MIMLFMLGCGSPTRDNDFLAFDQTSNETQQKDKTPTKPNISQNQQSNNPTKPQEDNLTQPTFKVVKTGQTQIYSNFDDGYYQMGIDRNYTRDDKNEVVIDHVTNLMWQDNQDMSDRSLKVNYQGAIDYCKKLALGGYNNWRLPHIKELQNIIDDGRTDPAFDPIFENGIPSYYYSSTKVVDNKNLVWVVFTIHGNVGVADIGGQFYARCVRDIK